MTDVSPMDTLTIDPIPDTRGQTAFDWEAYGGRIEILKRMKNDPNHIDTVLVTDDGTTFPVNSVVVSVLGQQFTEAMYKQIRNSDVQSVEVSINGTKKMVRKVVVEKVTSESMAAIVDSCYTGQLTMTPITVWSVMDSAEYHGMKHIITGCCTFLSQLVNHENCLQMYVIGRRKNSEILLASSLMTIEKNFKSLATINKMFFSTIDGEHLNELLSSDNLNVDNETIVWTSIKTWINGDKSKRIKDLQKLLGHIRYHRTPIEFFEELKSDPLIVDGKAVNRINNIIDLMRNEQTRKKFKIDGNSLPVGKNPITVRPRIPRSVLFAVGGWKTGQTCSLIETYDYMTNKWFRQPSVELAPKKAYHGIEIHENKMFVVGGTNGNEILDTVHVYDPIDNTWTQKASLGTKRCYVATTILYGKIYAMGGHNGEFRMRSAEVYDIEMDVWTPISDMVIARSDGAAASLNGKVFMVGGLNEGSIESSIECYDPDKDEWTILRRMASPRTSLAVTILNGLLYAIGGNSGAERLASAESYDPETNTWTTIPPMIGKRSTFKAAVVDGKIYVCGGYNGAHPIAHCECYDPATESWKRVTDLSASRSGLAVVSIDSLPNIKKLTYYGN